MHESLAFLMSACTGSQFALSDFEQETFAIYQTFEKLEYLFLNQQPINLQTDRRNIMFVLAPLSVRPALGKHFVSHVRSLALF